MVPEGSPERLERRLGTLLGALGPLLGRSWALLGRSWALLGRSWDALGALLGPCWAYLAKKHRKIQKLSEILIQLGKQNGGQNH